MRHPWDNILQVCYWILAVVGLAILFHATPSWAISYTFAGTLADGGTITGAFAYNEAAAPIATNVRNLSPNQVFGVTSSSFTVTPVSTFFPAFTAPIHEFCTGNCIFSAGTVTALTIRSASGVPLLLAWTGDFGAFHTGSNLRNAAGGMLMVRTGVLTQTSAQTVPEPSTGLLGLLGFAGIVLWRRIRWVWKGL